MSQQDNNPEGPPPPIVHDFAEATPARPSSSRSISPATPIPADQQPAGPPQESAHLRYDLSVDTQVAAEAGRPARSDTQLSWSPNLRRRDTRARTFKAVEDFKDFELRTGWHPGAEPGVDPTKPDGGHASWEALQYPCEITVVDFSQARMEQHRLENATLSAFLDQPQPKWARCRWINVNGLSWDVISALGKYKNLHKLAIEDIMNTRNRTKADWYSNHAFIILSLQKLVHLQDPDSSDDESDDGSNRSTISGGSSKRGTGSKMKRWWRQRLRKSTTEDPLRSMDDGFGASDLKAQSTGFSDSSQPNVSRTLQRYHSSPNDVRTDFMEKYSVLSDRKLAVMAEQVSLFITNDNCIISFFELSAADIELPIITRIGTPDTVLRQSCDASMIGQAILDAIIDLAIPVTSCYGDVIGDLELDVLTRPNITHTKKLYISITEMNKILSFINPIISMINSLRDHKSEALQEFAAHDLQNPLTGVVITPLTHTYLGDVLDHAVLISDSLQQLRGQAEGMIDLIFNTISAYQNESLKQLTLMTIIFLPLTFITGYFGMNFQPFEVLQYDVQYFWKIAIPAAAGTCLFVMRDIIWESLQSMLQRRDVVRLRKEKSNKRRSKRKIK